jgi:hypothetical protein
MGLAVGSATQQEQGTNAHLATSPPLARTLEVRVVADFGYRVSGSEVLFTDKSQGVIVNWTWAFGDGSFSFDQNPTHTYAGTGKYQVTLRVLDFNRFEVQKAVWINLNGFDTKTLSALSGILLMIAGVVWIGRADPGFGKLVGFIIIAVGMAFIGSLGTDQDLMSRIIVLLGFMG